MELDLNNLDNYMYGRAKDMYGKGAEAGQGLLQSIQYPSEPLRRLHILEAAAQEQYEDDKEDEM